MADLRLSPAAACAVALVLSGAGAPRAAPAGPAGKYSVRTTANVRASPVVDERFERDLDVTLSREAPGGALRVRLESERYACDLTAQLSASGELAFEPKQRCALAVDEPTARGRVEASLESGRGRVQGEKLEIDVSWALSGSMSLLVGGETMEVLGREVAVPATWMPEVPLRGTVRASGAGTRLAPSRTR